jgi:putative transposase
VSFAPLARRQLDWLPAAEVRGEGIFATLECELLDRRRLRTQAEARLAVSDFIEGWYNPHRRHSSLDYLSPIAYEKRELLPL